MDISFFTYLNTQVVHIWRESDHPEKDAAISLHPNILLLLLTL
jgi:hypothetical protein